MHKGSNLFLRNDTSPYKIMDHPINVETCLTYQTKFAESFIAITKNVNVLEKK